MLKKFPWQLPNTTWNCTDTIWHIPDTVWYLSDTIWNILDPIRPFLTPSDTLLIPSWHYLKPIWHNLNTIWHLSDSILPFPYTILTPHNTILTTKINQDQPQLTMINQDCLLIILPVSFVYSSFKPKFTSKPWLQPLGACFFLLLTMWEHKRADWQDGAITKLLSTSS